MLPEARLLRDYTCPRPWRATFASVTFSCSARHGVHHKAHGRLSAVEAAQQTPKALIGYAVRALPRKQFIGRVDKVKSTDEAGLSPPNLLVIHEDPERGYGLERHYIPYVPQIVKQIDRSTQELLIKPPKGLLNLGRERAALKYVEPLLKAFIQQHGESKREISVPARALAMPARSELRAAGEHSLVRAIEHAGGFLAVAQALGLRSKRRPPGYWDSPEVLDEEIGQFVAANWTQLEDADAGLTYFYNQITHRTQFDQPIQPQRIALDDEESFMLVEDELDRVMPSRRVVMAAGRYDLHHAIQYHGGYTQVGEMLERPSAWPYFQYLRDMNALKSAIEGHNMEQGHARECMPVLAALARTGRDDLVRAIGAAVAETLGLRTQRRRKHGSSASLDVAVGLVRAYLEGLPRGSPAHARLPSQSELIACGRHDVRFALQVHGSEAVAKALGLPVRRRGRPPSRAHSM